MFFKKFTIAIILCAITISICCACHSQHMVDSVPTIETSEQQTQLLKINSSGGYTLTTDTLTCTVIGDGNNLYVYSQSYEAGRVIECYANSDTVTVVESVNGGVKYATFENHMFSLSNPLTTYIRNLNTLTDYTSDVEVSDDTIYTTYLFCIENDPPTNMSYVVSKITLTWIDGKQYQFEYYDYANDSVCVSNTAPLEIQNSQDWTIDIDQKLIYNKITNETLKINVDDISIGYGQSPMNTPSESHQIKAFVDEQTGFVSKIMQTREDKTITIVSINGNDLIKSPKITDQYEKMTDSEASSALLLAYTVSLLI